MAESEEELTSLLMRVKEESEKAGLKLNTHKTKIMANKQGKSGNTGRFYFLGLQNRYGRWLQPWNQKMIASLHESYDKPRHSIKKQRYYFANKGQFSQTMVFPVVMYGFKSWTIKKSEYWRMDAFELWCWRRRLRVPWTTRRSNQSILKESNPDYSLEGLMLKLQLQYFGHLMQTADSLEKTDDGKDRRQGKKWAAEDEVDGWHHWLMRHEFEQALGDGVGQGSLACCSPWGLKESDTTEQLNNTHYKVACCA